MRTLLFATGTGRLRATWRILLAGVLAFPVTKAVSGRVASALGMRTMLVVGVAQAACFAVLLVCWARYVDRRRLADYGFAATPSWGLDLAVGFGAVFAAFALWFGVGSALGWTGVAVSLSAPGGSATVGLATAFVALGLNVWVQETVFYGLVLKNAAEGLRGRGLAARRAVLAALCLAAVYFVLIHGETRPRFMFDLAVAGAVFGALYVHTGSLALPIGAHLGANFVGGRVFVPASAAGDRAAVLVVSGGVPGLDLLNMGFPKVVVAYLLLLGWLRWRRGGAGIEATIAEWTGR